MSNRKPISSDFLETTDLPQKSFAALRVLFAGQWLRVSAAAVFYLVKHSPVWIAPIITALIINLVVANKPGAFEQAVFLGLILAAVIVQNIPNHTVFVRLLNGSIRTVEARTRMTLIRRLQQLNLGFHDSARSGALQNKVLRDVENIGVMVSQFINSVLATVITVAVSLIYTLSKEPIVALFYLVTVPIAVSLLRVFGRQLRNNTQSYRQALEGMSVKVTEVLTMLPITRAHAVEEHELDKVSAEMERVAVSGKKQDVLNGIFGATSWVMFQLFSLVSLLVTGYLALKGQIPIGDVVLYQGFFAAIVGGVNQMVTVFPDLTKGFNAIHSVGEVLRSPDIERNEGKQPVRELKGAFSFRNVYFRYPSGTHDVLSDVTFDVQAGETIAFVGQSGSGKSTLTNLIIGFYRPTSGTVFLDGQDMNLLDLRDFRKSLSVVSQNTILFSGSIRDNVSYGRAEVEEDRIKQALVAANAWDFIQELPQGLDSLLGEHGGRLSGGQRQRIAIARALIRDPRVIIFDEATSALDVDSERQVQAALDTLIRDRTTFIVAHRLSTIRNADRIAVLKHGHLAELGTHEELLAKKGEFAKLVKLYH